MDLSTDTTHSEERDKDVMQIVEEYPPNFELIRAALPDATGDYTYCYGDVIYNPSGKHLTIDQQFHELIHSKRQAEMGDPDAWWYSYLTDRRFRLQEEIVAYGEQYLYAKQKIEAADAQARAENPPKRLVFSKTNMLKWIKENMARALSGEAYGSLIGYAEAESAIRNYGKSKE